MKLLKGDMINDNEMRVTYCHNEPETLPKEFLEDGILVESVPVKEKVFGKEPIHIINIITKEQRIEYIDRPLEPSEEIESLKAKIILMEQALDDMILNSGGAL
jgi:hypothetical protein